MAGAVIGSRGALTRRAFLAGVRREDVDLRLALDWALARMKREGRDLEILRRFGLGEENREPVGGA